MRQLNPYTGLKQCSDLTQYDIIVLGAGAGGMAAALFGAIEGKKVLLVERTHFVGGTTALSGGTTWVPMTRYLHDTAMQDSKEKVMNFLDHAVGNRSKHSLRRAFVDHGAKAIDTLVDHTEVRFRACAYHPDYLADLPDASLNGRALEPLPYVGQRLGKALNLLRHPIPEFTVLGGMMVNREDIGHLLSRFKNAASFLYTARVVTQYAIDRALYGRTRRSVMGHALVARMLQSLLDKHIDLLVDTETLAIDNDSSAHVSQLTLRQHGESRRLIAKKAVILASGGFARNPEKRAALLPSQLPNDSPSAEGHSSDLHAQVEALGAHYGEGHDQAAFWAPVSTRLRKDGSTAVFPHFVFDRSKPGTLCVNARGQRFVNETVSYHEFGKAMLNGGQDTTYAWIITDAKGLEKYGLGMVRLGGDNPHPYLQDGYLKTGDSIAQLAQQIQVDDVLLTNSIHSINEAANIGHDKAFGRGRTAYQKANGDPNHQPNPTLGALDQPPYYAVRLQPADIGTAQGLVGNEHAQLLTRQGTPIDRLYACGNDLHSIMGGTYPGPGITIGPAIVFAYLAIQHAIR
ncbi:FAD-dependent oxidoreductase [Marinomonas sp. IMCC 4694]|uniref:FAD-dependent oxidoreductase n=1 Tax=Marinomonas sp. IMCC 4694 TaxID=2605432 RepID=UPI0011E6183C|nr:FAD-dependent oxidoreductase [Marinomonas sp. IMCC 4694]TYL48838.1 FAD-dependent oxidoreductase [Marinomonas sp. IMCC 4694]